MQVHFNFIYVNDHIIISEKHHSICEFEEQATWEVVKYIFDVHSMPRSCSLKPLVWFVVNQCCQGAWGIWIWGCSNTANDPET